MGELQEVFLIKARAAAREAKHIFPEHAACEAALESAWGLSRLARHANNLFGQKQSHPPVPGTETMELITRECLHGAWVTVPANWVKFADWVSCFAARMEILQRLAVAYPHYGLALKAGNGEEFIAEVSESWSTDPARGTKVLAVYQAHSSTFAESVA